MTGTAVIITHAWVGSHSNRPDREIPTLHLVLHKHLQGMFIPVAGYMGSCLASIAGYFACQACTCISREILTQSARVAWSALFFVAMITAWILRDFAKPLLEKIPCKPSCEG